MLPGSRVRKPCFVLVVTLRSDLMLKVSVAQPMGCGQWHLSMATRTDTCIAKVYTEFEGWWPWIKRTQGSDRHGYPSLLLSRHPPV